MLEKRLERSTQVLHEFSIGESCSHGQHARKAVRVHHHVDVQVVRCGRRHVVVLRDLLFHTRLRDTGKELLDASRAHISGVVEKLEEPRLLLGDSDVGQSVRLKDGLRVVGVHPVVLGHPLKRPLVQRLHEPFHPTKPAVEWLGRAACGVCHPPRSHGLVAVAHYDAKCRVEYLILAKALSSHMTILFNNICNITIVILQMKKNSVKRLSAAICGHPLCLHDRCAVARATGSSRKAQGKPV